MIVMKFGGSSLESAERIRQAADNIKMLLNEQPVIVVSALGKTTDNLIDAGNRALLGDLHFENIVDFHYRIADELGIEKNEIVLLFNQLKELLVGISLIKEQSPKTLDYLQSFGERISARIFSAYLAKAGLASRYFDSWDIGFTSDSNFNNAEILDETYSKINSAFNSLKNNYSFTPVITGFIAKDSFGNITTLGRGGSDLTASIVGCALEAREIQVWKDVDGIMTTDPKVVPQARPVKFLSYDEASELAYFGAKVLHPRSILPAIKRNIPVRVKSFLNPSDSGTEIVSRVAEGNELLRAITFKKNIILVDVVSTRMLGQYGFLAMVFKIFSDLKISVDVVASSEVSISLTLDNNVSDLEKLKKELEKIAVVNINAGKTIISLIGNVSRSSEILNKTCSVLAKNYVNVQMISQGASKVNISFIVNDHEAENCIKELHKVFFEELK